MTIASLSTDSYASSWLHAMFVSFMLMLSLTTLISVAILIPRESKWSASKLVWYEVPFSQRISSSSELQALSIEEQDLNNLCKLFT